MISKVNIKTAEFSSKVENPKKENQIKSKESLKTSSKDKLKIFEIITKASVHLGH